jgi:hypothetical protein
MPPKKKLEEEPSVEGSSQVAEGQVLATVQTTTQTTHIPQTTHPQASTEPRPATTETRRPEYSVEQPLTQALVLAMNTSAPNTQPPLQHQETEIQEDQQQDSEEEIEAIIEDELVLLRQENERLRLMQEQLYRRKAMAQRSHIV